ncbi:MAG: hypothetical protein ACRCYV_00085, partial [Aeromonas sp.]
DLAIITQKPLSLAVYAGITDAFAQSDLPWRVDVIDWAATSVSFRQIIQHHKIVLQLPAIN